MTDISLSTVGATPIIIPPEELQSRLQADIAKWAAVIERAGIPKQ